MILFLTDGSRGGMSHETLRAQIPAKPVLRKYARCIEHQVLKTEYF